MKQLKTVIYIHMALFGLSTVANVLYIADVVGEIWHIFGTPVVVAYDVVYFIMALRQKDFKFHTDKKTMALFISVAMLWLVTNSIAIFR